MHHEQVYAMECLRRLTPPPETGPLTWTRTRSGYSLAGRHPRAARAGQPQRQRPALTRRCLAGIPGTVAPSGSRNRSRPTPTTCG
jgi:hypothetical protein